MSSRLKKVRARRGAATLGRFETAPRLVCRATRSRSRLASCSSTRPGLRRIWRANADAVGAGKGYAPPFRTAITRRLRSSPACAFAASWRQRPSTGRSTRARSRNGWKNVSFPSSRKATSWSWTTCRATRDPKIEQLIKAAGAELRYLPPYSPDMNPIEKAYSKLKAFLRKPPNEPSRPC